MLLYLPLYSSLCTCHPFSTQNELSLGVSVPRPVYWFPDRLSRFVTPALNRFGRQKRFGLSPVVDPVQDRPSRSWTRCTGIPTEPSPNRPMCLVSVLSRSTGSQTGWVGSGVGWTGPGTDFVRKTQFFPQRPYFGLPIKGASSPTVF